MIVENRRVRAHVDKTLIILVFALSIFGVVAVCVATFPANSTATSFLGHIAESNSAVRQLIFLAVAPFILGVVMNIKYAFLRRFAGILYLGSTLLVLVVWVFNRATGVKQWLDIIWGFTIQPTEFAKLAIILMLARTLSRDEKPMNSLREFLRVMALVGVPLLIILFSGEMGSVLVIVFIFAVMMYFANVDIRLLGGLALTGILAMVALYGVMVATGSDNYRLQRILGFLNPELYSSSDAYQMLQSQMAIGSGGWDGIGIFVNGAISQLDYVPADWTDFIFATIGEAWGFVGCSIILIVYFLIILRMLYLARFTRDKFGMLVISGVMGMLLFHVFENIGMTLGLMPITGIPLPFLSYGGSNMVTNMAGVGLVLNVTRNRSLTAAVLTPQTDVNSYSLRGGRGRAL